jgi:hypothetical protein
MDLANTGRNLYGRSILLVVEAGLAGDLSGQSVGDPGSDGGAVAVAG